jgi:2-polyprenyl-3-methyl-5-hydroxy-6-metoxy-1,4-benzoquinol methylase
MTASTEGAEYAQRLVSLQQVWWKRVLPVQAPYRWNLRRLKLGSTLDVGCGIGRNLLHLDGNGVGIDHNSSSVAAARAAGVRAFTPSEFLASGLATRGSFDSLLVSHVLEHMTRAQAVELMQEHVAYVRAGGTVVLITPQERGFRSDSSHVEFMDFDALREVAAAVQLSVRRTYSFPFPRTAGSIFVYNEFVLVGTVSSSTPPAGLSTPVAASRVPRGTPAAG